LVKQRGLGGFPHERLLNPKGFKEATRVLGSRTLD
jgi:hypothetical protein